jgi:hypothetical protein
MTFTTTQQEQDKKFETEDEDWRAFINEAKADGWIFVKDDPSNWLRYCSLDCKNESESI